MLEEEIQNKFDVDGHILGKQKVDKHSKDALNLKEENQDSDRLIPRVE